MAFDRFDLLIFGRPNLQFNDWLTYNEKHYLMGSIVIPTVAPTYVGGQGGKGRMESRSVVKKGNSLYICLPSSMIEGLGIEKGDRCQFLLLPGYGILIRKEANENRFPAPLEAISNLQEAADKMFHDVRRKIKGMENQVVFHIWEKIFGLCVKDGLLNIYPPPSIANEPQDLLPEKSSEGQDDKLRGKINRGLLR